MSKLMGIPGITVLFWSFPLAVLAGNDHIENPDAGSLRPTAQPVFKQCPLTLQIIQGNLQAVARDAGPADSEDMYLIKIVNPAAFSATTDGASCAVSDLDGMLYCGESDSFDPALWLFALSGVTGAVGLLANDNISVVNNEARITSPSTDIPPTSIPAAGIYLLAITESGRVPVSMTKEGDLEIFDFMGDMDEISGPDGPGGVFEHTGWTGPSGGLTRPYTIILTGAEGFPLGSTCPAISSSAVVILALALMGTGAAVFSWRRRKGASGDELTPA